MSGPTIGFSAADDAVLAMVVVMAQRMCPVPYRAGALRAPHIDELTRAVLAEVDLDARVLTVTDPDRRVEVRLCRSTQTATDDDEAVLWVDVSRQRVAAQDERASLRVLREAARTSLAAFFARVQPG